MALFKKEVLIRPNSNLTVDEAVNQTRIFCNDFQNALSNKDESNNYIDYFFADLFDSRTGNIYRIFSDACSAFYEMPNVNGLIKYDILDINIINNDTIIVA